MKQPTTVTPIRRCMMGLAALTLTGAACSGSDSDNTTDTTDPVEDGTTDTNAADTADTADTGPVESDAESPDTAPLAEIPSEDGFAFTSPEGDYTITFPGEPTSTPLPIALPSGQVTAEAFIYEDGTTAAYFTSVFEYDQGVADEDPEIVLTGARDGAVTNVNGTLVESEFVEIDGVPGVSFSFTVNGGEGTALVYFDQSRLYQSFALGEVGQLASFETFLDTFQFTSNTAAGDS